MTETEKSTAMQLAVEYVKNHNDVAPLPFFVHLIRAFAKDNDGESDFRQLIPAIEKEEMITLKFISFAESAYYGSLKTSTVLAAYLRLGETKTKWALLALSLGNAFDVNACPAFDLSRYWTDMLYRACVAPFVASSVVQPKNSVIQPSEWYSVALTHNIGLRCLAQYEPETMHTLLSADDGDGNLSTGEYELFGFSHRELTSALLAHWGLPDIFHQSILHINNKSYRGPHWEIAAVLDITRAQSPDSDFDGEKFEALAREWNVSVSVEPVIASEAIDEAMGLAKLIFDPAEN